MDNISESANPQTKTLMNATLSNHDMFGYLLYLEHEEKRIAESEHVTCKKYNVGKSESA